MRVAIRVDSSAIIGSGHVMRCLTLAERLHETKDAEVHFISRDLEGNLYSKIRDKGFFLHVLPRHPFDESLVGYAAWLTVPQEMDAEETKTVLREIGKIDRLVVDHYALDIKWEREIRPFTKEIFVIDDLANRAHDCDILLEQGFRFHHETRYVGLVPPHCRLLLGPKYALLRDEFYDAKNFLRKRDGILRNIFVFYGGSDLTNETMKALCALEKLALPGVTVDVVAGENNPHRLEVEQYCERFAWMRYHCQVENIAELMSNADLALGAGGTNNLERCFLRLPALVTVTAENQRDGCTQCAHLGIIECLGWHENVSVDTMIRVLQELTPERLLGMADHCVQCFSWRENNAIKQNSICFG